MTGFYVLSSWLTRPSAQVGRFPSFGQVRVWEKELKCHLFVSSSFNIVDYSGPKETKQRKEEK